MPHGEAKALPEPASSSSAAGAADAAATAAAGAAEAADTERRASNAAASSSGAWAGGVQVLHLPGSSSRGAEGGDVLLELQGLSISTPDGSSVLVKDLELQVGLPLAALSTCMPACMRVHWCVMIVMQVRWELLRLPSGFRFTVRPVSTGRGATAMAALPSPCFVVTLLHCSACWPRCCHLQQAAANVVCDTRGY